MDAEGRGGKPPVPAGVAAEMVRLSTRHCLRTAPGSVHDINAARNHVLPTPYTPKDLSTLADRDTP
ncbi:MAG: hypothetical protein ACRCYU_10365 [Nocardioides sp.]